LADKNENSDKATQTSTVEHASINKTIAYTETILANQPAMVQTTV